VNVSNFTVLMTVSYTFHFDSLCYSPRVIVSIYFHITIFLDAGHAAVNIPGNLEYLKAVQSL
jgi:hypothetical protein